jgi:uncharacterized protein with HEPN domain
MSRRNDRLLILDIIDSIEKVKRYSEGLNYRQFSKDYKTIDAVVRNFEIIGEASNHLSKKVKDGIKLPWRRIIGMRNVIIHEYFGVDTRIVWKIITDELNSLLDEFRKYLEKFKYD